MITKTIIYLCFCLMYRQRKENQLFILKTLQTLKISKYRNRIVEKIQKYEKRSKLFLFWPLVDLYEWYENYKENRNRASKS
jgi:hypothetical protein